MQASLYLNTSTQMRKDEIMQKLRSSSEKDKIEGMKQMIAQMSQGEDFSALTHKITKETLVVKSNELKRLFYYYLELLPKSRGTQSFEEMLLLSNQVRKDLEHPNEYVRGFAMRFVSTLDDQELVGNFYKLVKDNFNHPNSYVRRNAYFCLGEVFLKMDTYREVPDLLYHALLRDMDPNCLREAFVSLHLVDPGLALKYAGEVDLSIPSELSTAIIEKIDDERLLERFLFSGDSLTAFEAGISIHKTSNDQQLLKRATDTILRCLEDLPGYREYAIDVFLLSAYSFSGYAMSFISMVDPYDLGFCSKCLDFGFKISETHEFLQISDFLGSKFIETHDASVQNQSFRVLLLEKMAYFADVYSSYSREVVSEALEGIASENPEMSYGSLTFLSSCLEVMRKGFEPGREDATGYLEYLERLTGKINEVKYGKILRCCFGLLRKHVTKDVFAKVVGILDSSFELSDKPLYLRSTQTFLGAFICIELSEMCRNLGGDSKDRVIGIMLKFIEHGKESKTMDGSSHSTIVSCIRSLISSSERIEVSSDSYKRCREDVFDPIVLPGTRVCDEGNLNKLHEFLAGDESGEAEMKNITQLTGLSDPIYVEATTSYTRYEVVLDMLLINQTSSYLQNILLDFVTSQGFSATFVNTPFSLSSRSVITKRFAFRIIDGSNGFISGSITFRYPDESGEYANTAYTINLSEVKTSISKFLEPKKIDSDRFREMWKELEWENTYTLKFVTRRALEEIFGEVSKALSGEMLDVECDESYAVGNIACSTLQNVCVLINVCLRRGEYVHFESRIRSRKEGIVKSVSAVVGDVLKSLKNK
ncbi:coatomer subunit beta [Encephalitozoon hellem ATCC 50504]|uniref:Coatomer subunit beta n=1 Tax=Encephalitozoon hellem TaxID=27973 RepID=A0A9Q9C432_ENCHE|nr:coatomer subunit beta [Encephalitozoon hellem ATCC 50504]AFM98809.1 coatomer subunit beta [Encephalitozoon hellem ATCC 50504]UTX43786.1 coatomer complex subunit beta [Encephalitozoon hellem]|eukprot:XP_003887790.1 coatomer subunit beta [Encephalitozoon hellem ATCC 50504]